MFKLKRCCFLNIKQGAIITSIYSLIYYSFMFSSKTVHIHTTAIENKLTSYLTWVSILVSCFVVICSLLLLAGIIYNQRQLFLPWLFAINLINVIDFILIFELFQDTRGLNPFFFALVVFDVGIFFLNIYGFACVLVHYCHINATGNEQRRSVEIQSLNDNISKDFLFALTPQQTLETSNTLSSQT